MNDFTKTLVFVGVAAISTVSAWFLKPTFTDPRMLSNTNVGAEFYPEFDSAADASAFEVVMFNDATASIERFGIEYQNGLWTIPTHNNYPADAAEKFAKTVASLLGIEREEFRSKEKTDHAELGVVDPIGASKEQLTGLGDRVTLKGPGGDVVADYIIGKKVKSREGYFYVRRPDETTTYAAKLDLNLSTKFADWVETDLLKVEQADIRDISINKYSINEQTGTTGKHDVTIITRETGTGPWTVEGLKEETEEVDTSKVGTISSELANLKLIGVRRKPDDLIAALKGEGQGIMQATVLDLRAKGFYIQNGPNGAGIVANEGEMRVSKQNGVGYQLRFGEIFTGSQMALEAGGLGTGDDSSKGDSAEAASGNDKKSDTEEKTEDAPKSEDATKAGESSEEPIEEPTKDDTIRGRYLFVEAIIDERMLGEKPVEPVAPPEAEDGAKAAEDKTKKGATEDKTKEDEKAAEEKKSDESQCQEPGAEQKSEPPAGDPKTQEPAKKSEQPDQKAQEPETKPDPKEEYKKAKAEFERQVDQYMKKRDSAIEEMKKLNIRFSEWYYVISEEDFNKLSAGRADIVKPKKDEPAAETTPGQPGTAPIVVPPNSGKAQPKGGEPKAQPKGGEPKAQPKGGEPKAQPKGGEPKAQPKGGEPKAQPKGEEPKAQPKGGEPKAQPKGEQPKAQPKGAEPKAQPKGEEPKNRN